MSDQERDFAAAQRAFAATRPRSSPPDKLALIAFTSQLQFFLTIGYLTNDQATALVTWFKSNGISRLPKLEGPPGIGGPSMYEILSTRITVGTPTQVFDLTPEEFAAADIGDFFSGLVDAVSDLVSTVADGVTQILSAGTSLIQAGTQLVHEVHETLLAL